MSNVVKESKSMRWINTKGSGGGRIIGNKVRKRGKFNTKTNVLLPKSPCSSQCKYFSELLAPKA